MHTAVGVDLFSFGHSDGAAENALLQHPLGLVVLDDGTVAVADTYNGAVRRYDPASRRMSRPSPPAWPSRPGCPYTKVSGWPWNPPGTG